MDRAQHGARVAATAGLLAWASVSLGSAGCLIADNAKFGAGAEDGGSGSSEKDGSAEDPTSTQLDGDTESGAQTETETESGPDPTRAETESGTETETTGAGECPEGMLDCDEFPGCESAIDSIETCGSCEHSCVWEGAEVTCLDPGAGLCEGELEIGDFADSFIALDNPESNFGSELTIHVQAGTPELAFLDLPPLPDLPEAATITDIELELICNFSGFEVSVTAVDGAWAEETITWANQPLVALGSLGTFQTTLGKTEVDLTEHRDNWGELEPNGISLSVVLDQPPVHLEIPSRESGMGPVLCVTATW